MGEITKIVVFKDKKIRRTLHHDEWWFVVEDIVVALTDTPNPKDYINKMRLRDDELSKGYGQIVHTLFVDTAAGQKVSTPENYLKTYQNPKLPEGKMETVN